MKGPHFCPARSLLFLWHFVCSCGKRSTVYFVCASSEANRAASVRWCISYGPGTQAQSLVDMVEVFDPKTSHWEKAASLNIPRAHVCCVTFQDKLWAVGGYDGQHASQTVEVYDPVTKRWTEGPKLIKKRSVVVCSVLDDKLYAIGGYDGQTYLKCSEVYDPDAKRWVPGPDMTVSRGRHCVCTLPI
jgi:N-acetylneuraminic acid mutarotase